MKVHSEAVKQNLQNRLSRIEGQARGVQKMLDDERDCREILQQLKAIRSAIENATTDFMHTYAKECLLQLDESDLAARTVMVDELLDLMARVR